MSTTIFLISGIISLGITLALIIFIYSKSPSTRDEVRFWKLLSVIVLIYGLINTFYFFKLIPPVPLAMDQSIVAHNISMQDNNYLITFETDDWYVFWREHRIKYVYKPNENVFLFTSVFAPKDLEKSIIHRWKWYNNKSSQWGIVEDIGYDIKGGRDNGYRGYTYKNNVKQGEWKVEVITNEELVLGVVDFEIIINSSLKPKGLKERKF